MKSSQQNYISKIMTRGVTQLRRFPYTAKYVDQILGDTDISELIKGSGIAFIFKILSLPIGLAISLIISRRYGADAMGLYGLMTTIIGICVSIGMLGLGAAMPRFLGQARAEQSGDEPAIYRTSVRLILLSGLILSGGLYFGSKWIALGVFDEAKLLFPLQVGALFLIPMMIQNLNIQFLIASKQIYHAELISKAIMPIIMLLIVFGSYWIWPTYYIPIWAWFLTAGLGMIITLYILWKHKYVAIRGILYKWKEMLKVSGPMLVTGMAFIVVTYTDILMLGALADTNDVGIYKVIVQLATLVTIIMSIISIYLGPQLSEQIWGDKKETIQITLKIANIGSSIPATVIGLFLIGLGPYILSLFGDEFIIGIFPLYILVGYQLINVITGYGGLILNNGGYEKLYRNVLLSASFCNIMLNYTLIPLRGMVGAAISTALSFNIANFVVVYYCIKKTGIKPYLYFK